MIAGSCVATRKAPVDVNVGGGSPPPWFCGQWAAAVLGGMAATSGVSTPTRPTA